MGKVAVFVMKQVETDVFEGHEKKEEDGGGRMDGEWRENGGGWREDVPGL